MILISKANLFKVFTMQYWIVPLLLVSFNIGIGDSTFCFWNSGCHYKCLSSKTPYNTIRGDIRDSLVHIKGCEPISIWGLYRHGKRTPSHFFAEKMQRAISLQNDLVASYAAGNSSLCAQDVENLKNWKINTQLFAHYTLADEGYREMRDLGTRLEQAFPTLLGTLEENSYIVQPCMTPVTEASAKAFVQGFNNNNLSYQFPTGLDPMTPYFTCEKYQKMRREGSPTYKEAERYLFHPDYLAVKDGIQRRSGIDFILTDENITALYDVCRYDSSGYDIKLSPWCALFTTEDLLVLDYIGDLRHYYRNGYGLGFAENFGRLPLQNLLESFKQAKEGQGKKLSTYISHATTLDMVYTALGLFKDKKVLTGAQRDPTRKWRSCRLSTFGSNLMAVLNRCTKNDTLDEYNVIFYHNEEPLRSICKDGVCAWQEFEEKLTFGKVTLDFCS